MTTSTEKLDELLKLFMTSMVTVQTEAIDLEDLYWAEVSTDSTYTALASSAAATFATKLTKQEVINSLTIAEQVRKFFTNVAMTQNDYWNNFHGILYGNDEYTSPGISTAIEAYGTRAVSFIGTLLTEFNRSRDILDIYFDTTINAAIAAVTVEECPWYEYTKDDLIDGLTLVENFKKLFNNEAPTTGDYGSTLARWRKII